VLNGTHRQLDLGYARLDLDRAARTGDPEAVLADGKTDAEVVSILRTLHEHSTDRAVIATRCSESALAACADVFREAAVIDTRARTVVLGTLPTPCGTVAVVTAGTSDLPVALEAVATVKVHGACPDLVTDVGVAGLHRVLGERDRIDAADAIVVAAGMDGALPSVVAGLTGVPIIAVPTSVGYGASFDGLAALLSMLNACAPGVSVVNIDNGYGAGVIAARIARGSRAARRR
jgi:pyridinium-3,5-biscarboxylic acid mononucleotide synthase